MSAIQKLIRFHRFQLDERRRGLKRLEDELAAAEEKVVALTVQIEKEKLLASQDFQASRDYGNFIEAALERLKAMEGEREIAAGRVDAAREEVREAFAEVKKYEITQANRDAEAARETERRERVELDEIALNNHRLRR
ncbi:MAG TPA: hypothetical protein DCS82_05925 [Rhodospirillaceae bacterium]|nr:hypothetical protein [Rhodospirillaceae bacterium]HAA92491.1 hypothetical protein [Rhodospirillaceae bacterium]HAT35233.1 hypothetical protein [Rhodospirillaceae bacterium]